MRSTDRIGTREIIFEIMAPLMHDDVIVEFFGVVCRIAEKKQRIDIGTVKRCA